MRRKINFFSRISLNDTDRKPWLFSISKFIKNFDENENLIFACSALKKIYRDWISQDNEDCFFIFIHLKGSLDLIQERLLKRTNHFMNSNLLTSQFETLEELKEKEKGFEIDISKNANEIIKEIIDQLKDMNMNESFIN